MAKALEQDEMFRRHVETRPPPLVGDGDDVIEDLGSFVNWITGTKRAERKILEKTNHLVMSFGEWSGPGSDPEPIEPPRAIPDGYDSGSRGGKPSDFETK